MRDVRVDKIKYFIYYKGDKNIVVHESAEEMLRWVTLLPGGSYIIIKGEELGDIRIQLQEDPMDRLSYDEEKNDK